jgi:hypothetical protein
MGGTSPPTPPPTTKSTKDFLYFDRPKGRSTKERIFHVGRGAFKYKGEKKKKNLGVSFSKSRNTITDPECIR